MNNVLNDIYPRLPQVGGNLIVGGHCRRTPKRNTIKQTKTIKKI